MRRAAKWLAWILAVVIGVPVALVVLVVVGANLEPGRNLLVKLVPSLTGGQVAIAGLGGRFPDALRVATVELRDTKGAYLILHDVLLDWSPLRLAERVLDIERLTAASGSVARQPEPSSSSSSSSGLPVRLVVHQLQVGRLELAPAVVGAPYTLALDGSGRLDSYTAGQGQLAVTRLDTAGSYKLDANVDAAQVKLRLQADEPPHGLIAGLAKLPDLGAISINATLDGPRDAVATHLSVGAGPLAATAQGTVDLVHNAADLTIAAHAPAMTPRPDVSWQAVALDARVQGAFERPNVNGQVRLDQVNAAGGGVQRLTADIAGNQGLVHLHATADGLRVPGSPPDLFASAPLTLDATAHLEAPDRPVEFTLRHPLLSAQGSAQTAGALQAKMRLTIPQLAPFAAVAGATLQGHTTLDLSGGMQDGDTQLAVTGTVGLDSGTPPAPALLGNDAHIDLLASMHGQDLHGHAVRAERTGGHCLGAWSCRAGQRRSGLGRGVVGSNRGATEPQGQAGGPGACRWHAAGSFGGGGPER